ncbi:MAG TPA: hypothetical protein VK993_10055 [Chthoniobacterales bacterium]|nr:hypothetical protein [Chthoniobacterales bacterium]
MTRLKNGRHLQTGGWRKRGRAVLFNALFALATDTVEAAPRLISYGNPNCISCHVSVQGRGLLNSYGRGIDIAQSYSKKDFTAMLLGRAGEGAEASETWDGRFNNVLADFLVTLRLSQRFDVEKTDPAIFALYRQVIFLDKEDRFRVNTEIGFLDGGLADAPIGPHLTATGGDNIFLRKLLLEWRIEASDTSGKEVAFGRDYLPLGLQIDDHTAYILYLNRGGIYDFPLQLKYFTWDERSLASVFLHAPSFEEASDRREYGGGFLYERYPTNKLALGLQGLVGFSDESDRLRIGPYARWGISEKWALLAQTDYTVVWDTGSRDGQGSQVTAFLQLFYHHTEWLISSGTANYAYSDSLRAKDDLVFFRYTTAARLNRNFTLGISYAAGDILRNLGAGQELAVFATVKF